MPQQCTCLLHVSSYILWPRQVQILQSFLQAREWVSRVGKGWAWRLSRISLLGSIAHRALVFIANTGQAHCILLFCMRPPCAPLCFQHFCNPAWPLSHACRARSLSTAPPWWCLMSFVLSFLRFMQHFPFSFLGLSARHAMIALLFEFIFSLSCQEVLLSPL